MGEAEGGPAEVEPTGEPSPAPVQPAITKPAPRRRPKVILVGLLAVPLLLVLFPQYVAERYEVFRRTLASLDFKAKNFEAGAGITVAAPSVHTRERLLNDRFEQMAWLDKQIKQANLPEANPAQQDFETPRDITQKDGSRSTDAKANSEGQQASARAGANAQSDVTRKRAIGGGTLRHDFEVVNGFRDLLRSERAVAMLDDRHDMDDNTIYLLSFDTTVLPAPGSRGFAAVEAVVTRDPRDLPDFFSVPGGRDAWERLNQYAHQDTFDVYLNWLERLRRLDERVVLSLAATLAGDNRALPPQLDNLLSVLRVVACTDIVTIYMRQRPPAAGRDVARSACISAAGGEESSSTDSNSIISNGAIIALSYIDTDVRSKQAAFNSKAREIYGMRAVPGLDVYLSNLRGLQREEVDKKFRVEDRVSRILANPGQATWTYDEALRVCDHLNYTLVPQKDQDLHDLIVRTNGSRPADQLAPKGEKADVMLLFSPEDCPPILTPGEQAKWLYAIIDSMKNTQPYHSMDRLEEIGIMAVYEYPPFIAVQEYARSTPVDPTCIAAVWLREQANLATANSPRNHGAGLSEFFDFQVRPQGDGTCRLAVDPKISSLRLRGLGAHTELVHSSLPRISVSLSRDKASGLFSGDATRNLHVNTIKALSVGSVISVLVTDPLSGKPSGRCWDATVIDLVKDGNDKDGGTLVFQDPVPERPVNGEHIVVSNGTACHRRAEEQAIATVDYDPLPIATYGNITAETYSKLREVHGSLVNDIVGASWDDPYPVSVINSKNMIDISNTQNEIIAAEPPASEKDMREPGPSPGLRIIFKYPILNYTEKTQIQPDPDRRLLTHLNSLLDGPGYSDRTASPMTRAFSYGLSPRLREHVHEAVSDKTSVSGDFVGITFGARGHEELDLETVEPEVVGFSRASMRGERILSGARFGWMIAPRPDGASSWESTLPLQQVQLGALLAVPSWWRTALIEVCSGFARRSEVASVVQSEYWATGRDCRVETVRLPGTAADVSRHLGMDVLTYPAVWAPTLPDGNAAQPPTIVANDRSKPASILIHGERLWRSTVVTLGGQQQDHIQVLPDMSGIIATFACVDVPTITTRVQLLSNNTPSLFDSYEVPLVVWTSEGHSEELPTTVAVTKPVPGEMTAPHPCHPDERETSQHQPTSTAMTSTPLQNTAQATAGSHP